MAWSGRAGRGLVRRGPAGTGKVGLGQAGQGKVHNKRFKCPERDSPVKSGERHAVEC